MKSNALYSFSPETLSNLKKFRFSSGRSLNVQAVICEIDQTSYEITPVNLDTPIESIEELVEELPDNSPRFIILSYPMKTTDGRLKVPYVLIYWIPQTCGNQSRMLYAAAVELIRDKAAVGKLIKIEDEDEFDEIEELLQ